MNSPLIIVITTLACASYPDLPLTVDAAVRTALERSPRLRAARFAAQAAQAQTEREKPVARPTINAQAVGTIQGPRVTFPRAGSSDATVLPEEYGRLEVNLEQILYRAGLGPAKERYGAQNRATAWEELAAENDLILDVRRAYFELLTAQAMEVVARGGVDMAQKHLKLTRDMLEAGTASDRDVKAADADLAEAEQGALKAESGVALAGANVNRVMGLDPSARLAVAEPPALPDVPDSPTTAISQALVRRPEIKQLEENLRAARAGSILAATQDKPSISARATAATQTPSAFVRSEYFAASLVISWNPFDAGKTRADVKEAKAQAGRLEALLEDARLGIKLEVEKAWREMREARARIGSAERQLASAQAALDVSVLRFQARSATQLEVSGSLYAVAKARANRTQAVHDLHIAAAEFAHATGSDVRAGVGP